MFKAKAIELSDMTIVNVSCSFLTATCDKWESGKSISSIDTSQANKHCAWSQDKSDLARSPGGDHPAAQHASRVFLYSSHTQRAHPRSSGTECSKGRNRGMR